FSRIVINKVYIIVHEGELTVSQEKCRVARYRLVKELHYFKEIFSLARGVSDTVVEGFFCSQVEIVGSEVRRRVLADCAFLLWRQLRLKLIGDFLRNLALDGEDIG